MNQHTATNQYVEANSKSHGISVALCVLLGPLGLLYSSPWLGVILCVVALLTANTVFIPLVLWIVSVFFGYTEVNAYNRKVEAQARLMADSRH